MFVIETKEDNSRVTIVLQNTQNKAYAQVFSFGAILNGYGFLGNESMNCVDGYENATAAIAEKNTWFKSCLLSPFVCRLKEGKFSINETQYTINKFYLGNHAIHGLVYDLDYAIAKQVETENFCSIVLQANYKAADEGFPFYYLIEHEYKLDDNGLTVATKITNQSQTTMPYAQGWHPYFKLGENVNDCFLQLSCSKQVEMNEQLIPTKKILYNANYVAASTLKNKNLDDCFVLENTKQAILQNTNYKFIVTAIKGYDFLQVFTPDHRKNIAIEVLSAAPDCFNNGLGLLQIEPNETKEFVVNYCLERL